MSSVMSMEVNRDR